MTRPETGQIKGLPQVLGLAVVGVMEPVADSVAYP
jgi:hypothetical protein